MKRLSRMLCTVGLLAASAGGAAAHEEPGKPAHHHAEPEAPPPAGVRMTMEQLHAVGGVPRGWKFTVPAADPTAGRRVFVALECFKCHAVKGEHFSTAPARHADDVGPDLTGMGDHHPAEYFAESLLDPNRVLIEGPGYIGPDGRSRMPDYLESMTLREWVDLVAYLTSLKDPSHPHGHAGPVPRRVGDASHSDYRIELLVAAGHGAGHAAPTPGRGHSQATAPGPARKHLMAVIRDRETGEAVPYLPVEAKVAVGGKTLKIAMPVMLGAIGLHYGADVALPPGKIHVTLQVGPSTLHRMASAPDRYGTPVRATFEWSE